MKRSILIVLLLALSGCAMAQDASISMQPNPVGNMVPVLELNMACPEAIAARPNGGCTVPENIRVIFNPEKDANQLAHEHDHVAGLSHGQWANGCSLILAGGYTRWRTGNLICRAVNGAYFQRAP